MQTVKCPSCNLSNFAGAPRCRRCDAALDAANDDLPYAHPGGSFGASAAWGALNEPRLEFKFKRIVNGSPSGLRARKAAVEDEWLALGDDCIPYEAITYAAAREKNILLAVAPGRHVGDTLEKMLNGNALVAQSYKVAAADVVRAINRRRALADARRVRNALAAAGEVHLHKTVTCPECRAIVDQTNLSATTHVFCPYCDSIFRGSSVVTSGAEFALCDNCNMFDRIRFYNEVYIFFALVVASWKMRRPLVCDNCAHTIFVKMLLANTLFLLGVPFTAHVKLRALSSRTPFTKNLMRANKLAKKGLYQEAGHVFADLYREAPGHPGLLYDEGVGHVNAGDAAGAAACFERALQSCNNYLPAAETLRRLREAMGSGAGSATRQQSRVGRAYEDNRSAPNA